MGGEELTSAAEGTALVIHEIILPKTGMYEDDVTLLEWLAEEGAEIKAGDVLFIMETDKANVEIAAEFDGKVHREQAEGLTAPVGTRVGALVTTEEEYRSLVS